MRAWSPAAAGNGATGEPDWAGTVLDRLAVAHATVFLCVFATDAALGLERYVAFFQMPIQLFLAMLAPIALRVHLPDLLRHEGRCTIALYRDHRHVLLPFLGLVMLGFATSLLPGAYLEGGSTKEVFILGYRFLMFAGAIVTAVLLWSTRWRLVLRLVLLVYVGSVLWDLAYPGTFSGVGSRASGFARNPNQAALTITLMTLMAVRYARVHALDLAILLLGFLAVFATLSRSGLLIFAVFVLNYLYFTGRGQRLRQLVWIPVAALVLVPLAGFAISSLTGRFEIFGDPNAQRRLATFALSNEAVYATDDVRLSLVPQYLALIDQAPLLGHGTGFSGSLPYGAHNMYLELWVNNGLFGMLLYLWLLLGLFGLAWKRGFPPGMALAQVLTVDGFFNHGSIQMGPVLILAGLAMGLSWCQARSTRPPGAVGGTSWRPRLTTTGRGDPR